MIYSGNKFGMFMLMDEFGQVDEYPLKRKLVMKGGHTHNHIKNKFTSNDIRSKDFRHIIKRAEEMKWNSRKSEIKLMNHYKKMRKWIKVWRSTNEKIPR